MLGELDRKKAFGPGGMLRPVTHDRLWQDLENLIEKSGISGHPHFVWEPLSKICSPGECEFVAKYRQHMEQGTYGVVYGHTATKVHTRMMAITGALLRNYINARVLPLQQVLAEARDNDGAYVDGTVLLIPDFHVFESSASEKNVGPKYKAPEWMVQAITAVLQRRLSEGKFTFVYSADPARIKHDYGSVVSGIIDSYQKVL